MNKYYKIIVYLFVLFFTNNCKPISEKNNEELFKLLPEDYTNISFSNKLNIGMNTNILMYEGFYNGGGVAVGDVNNDGLEDIYFTGNMVPNKLYLNLGKLEFKDATNMSNVAGKVGPWTTGVTMVDINGDNLLDIYICRSGNMAQNSKRTNQLFINKGVDKNGIPHFKEEAAKFGLNSPGFSTQASFFDYDKDGDLDMILINRNVSRLNINEASLDQFKKTNDPLNGIRLFKNNDGYFKDVTEQAGIESITFTSGLGVSIADLNKDSWPDIYISNDYVAPDYLYINNGNGTFEDKTAKMLGHTSRSSMGSDISDINNDGLPDIITVDMLPEDNYRQKILYTPTNYSEFKLIVDEGFHYQYMRNMLQLNNGNGSFSEIGQLANVSNTDWSWSPLFADFDNDGWQDLYITNGFLRDYTNLDFLKLLNKTLRKKGKNIHRKDLYELIPKIPKSDITNYVFKNNSNLTFQKFNSKWGITKPSNSNGAAYGDLDNDGDLDLIVNNIDKQAFIYENQEEQISNNYYLNIKLKGLAKNTYGLGAKVNIYFNNYKQYREQMPTRGFQSSVSPILHFGVGKTKIIDSLQIDWLSGRKQTIYEINTNQQLLLNEKDANNKIPDKPIVHPLLKKFNSPIDFKHKDKNANDFIRQPLMVNAQSTAGPPLVKADVNGDGLEDVYVGGGKGQAGRLFLQDKTGSFTSRFDFLFASDKKSNDTDAFFLDANKDGLQDLYVTSGGYNDYSPNSDLLQDRLYMNLGNGKFVNSTSALPQMYTSTSCVTVGDFNGDNYPDLFVGGQVIPGRYPVIPRSYLLINDGKGNFKDETSKIALGLIKIGMVSDAHWIDLNGDNKQDLIVVGKWMPISVFINRNGKLVNESSNYFHKSYNGWWNCILADDFDSDGKVDLIIGNHGLNSQVRVTEKEPAKLYYDDFNGDGFIDPIFSFFMEHKEYPFLTKDQLIRQLPEMRGKFPTYKSYANATIQDLFSKNVLKSTKHLEANYLKTAYFEQNDTGKFILKSLPLEAQFSPIYCIKSWDVNGDQQRDLLLFGNMNESPLRLGKYDANRGILLLNNGRGHYKYLSQKESGFHISGDVRSVITVDGTHLLIGVHGKKIEAYNNSGNN